MKLILYTKGFEFTPEYFDKMYHAIKNWVGDTNILYTYSAMKQGFFTFASNDTSIYTTLLRNANKNPKMFDETYFTGYRIVPIEIKEDFNCSSPIFARVYGTHLIGDEALEKVKHVLYQRAKQCNVELGSFDIKFTNFKKTKLITIDGEFYKSFLTELQITGSEDVKRFACQVGLGNCTEKGFGMIH